MPRLLLINEARLLEELDRSFVGRHEFEVIVAVDANGLIEAAHGNGASLIVVRMLMPGVTGPDLCRLLRASPRTASIPVLLLASPSERREAEAAAPAALLISPWTRLQLLESIRSFFPVTDRGAARAPVTLKVLCGEGREAYVAFTRDISTTGVFLKGASVAAPGTRLRLRLRLETDPKPLEYDVMGEVVRRIGLRQESAQPSGIGVRFLYLPLEGKLPLARFLNQHARA